MTKDDARRLQRDFIPNGKTVDASKLQFRRTAAEEIYQCCEAVAHDTQSCDIYCGKVAEFVSQIVEGNVVALCLKHKPPKHLILDELIVELHSK